MLEEARRTLAWWCDEARKCALRPRAWAAAADGFSFYAPDFALASRSPWLVGDLQPWPEVPFTPWPPLLRRQEPSRSAFGLMHAEIHRRLARSEFEKVVPIVCEALEFSAALDATHVAGAFKPMPGQMGYGFVMDGEGMAGVTPELLFAIDGGTIETMALAGTGLAGGPDLLADPKERREHQVVIEHIVREVRDFGAVEVGDTRERVYGALKHLHTPIRVRTHQQVPSFERLVQCLHPTAALGGYPRHSAVAWLKDQDFHVQRRRFGAPFGYFVSPEEARCLVAIRSVQWIGAQALVSAGCGIVVGSEVEKEWRELALKRTSIYRNLGLSL